jgi:hypothetical protein
MPSPIITFDVRSGYLDTWGARVIDDGGAYVPCKKHDDDTKAGNGGASKHAN